MIDYVKILIKEADITHIENLTKLDFKIEFSEKTGEISTKRIAEYHFCKVIIYDSGLVFFTGSIHKLWNSLNQTLAPNYKEWKNYKGYNGNQFTLENIVEVRQHLENLLNCNAKQMIFQNIEFGINTTPNFNPQLFIKGLLYHNGKPFEFRYNEHFAQVIHQRYYLKIYNKSTQYGIQNHTLRIELKVIKTEDIKQLGFKTFAEVNTPTLQKAKELLLKRFDVVTYFDNTITKKNFTDKQKQILHKYSNPRYWFNNVTKQSRYKHRKKLQEYIVNYSTNLHQQLRQEIKQKGLLINRLSETPKRLLINRSSIGLKSKPKTPKKCRVTMVDISMQKKDSILLSHTGLKHYFKTNLKEFEKIKNKYLSKKWMFADFETQVKEIAHNIRNKHNNQKVSRELKYKPNQTRIF